MVMARPREPSLSGFGTPQADGPGRAGITRNEAATDEGTRRSRRHAIDLVEDGPARAQASDDHAFHAPTGPKTMLPPATGAHSLLDPGNAPGAVFYGAIAFALASIATLVIRRSARRVEHGLSDTTVLQFVSLFAQLLAYLIAFVLYAHLVPQLRTLGTALLAGAGVASVVAGLAGQDTLGNLIAGFSLVLSKAIRVGDPIRLYCPVGVISAEVRAISLGFTVLVDQDDNEVVVPNSVMMNSAVVRVCTRRGWCRRRRGRHLTIDPGVRAAIAADLIPACGRTRPSSQCWRLPDRAFLPPRSIPSYATDQAMDPCAARRSSSGALTAA